ncbi:MAG: hypothetical protein NZ853_04835 [Leptospiraceae bacterium]|nr:hypothetical protein [Leptospiraceae bacterium]MDW7976728.1 hypothetical protein [Leptospiraceae bacterium]
MEIDFFLEELIDKVLYKKIYKISSIFHQNHFECYLVGGFLRDVLLKRAYRSKDIDIATNARPEEVSKLFHKVIPTGIKHGTVTILFEGLKIECTTYRKEGIYRDHRHPEKIDYAKTIYDDLSRRDFTVNAFAYDVLRNKLIDLYNGMSDLEKKILRSVGNPIERFLEDGLRPIRALRFLSTLGFKLEDKTESAIKNEAVRKSIQSISIERFTDELWKSFQAKQTSFMLKKLYELNLLELFLPASFLKIKEPSRYWFLYLDQFSSDVFKMALWFWSHKFSSYEVGKHWKFSNEKIQHISLYITLIEDFIKYHPFSEFTSDEINHKLLQDYSKIEIQRKLRGFREILSKIKKELGENSLKFLDNFKEWFLQESFNLNEKKIQTSKLLLEFYLWLKFSLDNEPLVIKDLAVNGIDLQKAGYQGKKIGEKLQDLLNLVLENPQHNQKDFLISKLVNP